MSLDRSPDPPLEGGGVGGGFGAEPDDDLPSPLSFLRDLSAEPPEPDDDPDFFEDLSPPPEPLALSSDFDFSRGRSADPPPVGGDADLPPDLSDDLSFAFPASLSRSLSRSLSLSLDLSAEMGGPFLSPPLPLDDLPDLSSSLSFASLPEPLPDFSSVFDRIGGPPDPLPGLSG